MLSAILPVGPEMPLRDPAASASRNHICDFRCARFCIHGGREKRESHVRVVFHAQAVCLRVRRPSSRCIAKQRGFRGDLHNLSGPLRFTTEPRCKLHLCHTGEIGSTAAGSGMDSLAQGGSGTTKSLYVWWCFRISSAGQMPAAAMHEPLQGRSHRHRRRHAVRPATIHFNSNELVLGSTCLESGCKKVGCTSWGHRFQWCGELHWFLFLLEELQECTGKRLATIDPKHQPPRPAVL